jgi:hypothetical protein
LSEKWHFWRFISQNVLETVCFFAIFKYISGGLEGLFDFYDPLHHHPWTGHSPAKSQHTKQFWSSPRGL